MPVNLNSLPSRLPEPQKLRIWIWIGLLFLFVAIGFLSSLSYSFFNQMSNFWFISCSFLLPISVWVFCFLYGLYIRFCNSMSIDDWNQNCDEERQELVNFAKRGLYVVKYSLVTEYGDYGNAEGIVNNRYLLSSKQASNNKKPVAHSAITVPGNLKINGAFERLTILFENWYKLYQPLFKQLSPELKIHVRLFIEANATVDELENLWAKTFGGAINSISFEIVEPKNSTKFTESWLDDTNYDDDLLFVISAHLFNAPAKNEGEFALCMLLAGEKANNRTFLTDADIQSLAIKIYRSEQTKMLTQTIDNALLWGGGVDEEYDGIWMSGVSPKQNIDIITHLTDSDFKLNTIFNIDSSIGDVGNCKYWLALALAAENTLSTNNKQFVVVGGPEVAASVVAYKG
jgi:hypothetical protein